MPILRLALLCHLGLMISGGLVVAGFALPAAAMLPLLVLLELPLLASWRGLRAVRLTTIRWLALVHVGLVGLGLVEVMASAGALVPATFLFFASVEFSCLVILARQATAPANRE